VTVWHGVISWKLLYVNVSAGVGDSLWVGISSRYVNSHPGQLSLLPSVGWEMITGGDALQLSSEGRMAHSIRG